MAPGELPEGARVAEAEARLTALLEQELGVSIGQQTPARGPAPTRRAERGGGGWLETLLRPSLRPAWGLAAAVIVAGGVWLAATTRQEREPVMRGPSATTPEGGLAATVTASPQEDGSIRLEWTATPEADRYVVVFLSPELVEVARVSDLRATRLELRSDALPAGLTPRARLLVRVLALRGADEVTRSRSMSVTLP